MSIAGEHTSKKSGFIPTEVVFRQTLCAIRCLLAICLALGMVHHLTDDSVVELIRTVAFANALSFWTLSGIHCLFCCSAALLPFVHWINAADGVHQSGVFFHAEGTRVAGLVAPYRVH